MKLKVYDENDKLVTITTGQIKKLFPQMRAMADRAEAEHVEHGAVILLRKGKLKLSKECIGGPCTVSPKISFLDEHLVNHSPVGTFHTHFDCSHDGEKLSPHDWCSTLTENASLTANTGEKLANMLSIECVSSDNPHAITCYAPVLTKKMGLTKKAKELKKHCYRRPGVLRYQFYPNYSKLLRKVIEKKYPPTYHEPVTLRLKKH